MTDSPQSIFHDPLAKASDSQDSQRITPLPASELQDVELFVAPSLDEMIRESISRKALPNQNLGRNHKVEAPEDEIVYVIVRPGHPEGNLIESVDDSKPHGFDAPVVDYLKLVSDNLPESKSKGRSRRRNRNRNR